MKKELELLNLLSENSSLSQRELSRLMDVSLGTVNNMISALDEGDKLTIIKETSRKVSYLLTDKGMAHKNVLYVEHISECFDTIARVRGAFKKSINQLVDEGVKNFYVQGDTDELIRLVKMCFFEVARKTDVKYELLNEVESFDSVYDVLTDDIIGKTLIIGWATEPSEDYKGLGYVNLLG